MPVRPVSRAGLHATLALAVMTLAVFGRLATFEFINFDDPGYVSDNVHVLDGLSLDGARWAFTTTRQANWHPLTWLSLQLDAEIGGPSPRTFHATNVVLHVASVLLLFSLFSRMTGSVWRSGLVAGLFAVHPLHVESVAWVAERKDVLSTALGLFACHLWVGSLDRPGVGRRIAACAAYAASLLAKPMLVSLPLLLLLFDLWPLRRTGGWRRLVLEKAPLFLLAAGSCVATYLAQAGGGVVRSLTQYPLATRAANAAVSYAGYLVKAVWPSGLSIYYPYPYEGIAAWKSIGAVALIVGITVACVRARSKAPHLLVGWLWYLVTLVPVIGLVQVGSQSMADRYTYIPLIGPFVMIAFALPDVTRRSFRWVPAACVAVLAVLAVLTYRQVGMWRDSVTLFSRAVSVTKENAVAENNLARALFERGRIDEAVAHCAEAVRIAPTLGDAQANLVRGLLAQGKTEEAAARTREALVARPEDSRTHVNAGLVARFEGRDNDALISFKRAIELDPADQEAHLNLGGLLATHGRREEAIAEFEEAVRLRPGDARARKALARLVENPG
jgi:tetratricopeptide (TPR) repeat protein